MMHYPQYHRQILWFGMAWLVAGCGAVLGPTAAEMTLQSQNHSLGTQIADLRSTATVEVDRMMITLEHASTEVRAVQGQRDALRATLIARGTDAGFLDVTEPELGDLPEGISPESLLPTPAGNNPAVAPAVTPPGGAPVAPVNPAAAPEAAVTPQTSGARLVNPTLATGVGSDDCAIDSVNTFDVNEEAIYMVATAVDFPANTVVTARWSREGTVMGSYDIPFDFEIANACIWAFIDQTDFVFTPGNWSVVLDINGTPAMAPMNFTITGGAGGEAGEAGMDDSGGTG